MPPIIETGPVTPVHRRQVRTDVPGVYRRGNRFIAVTQYRGRRIKSSHPTKAQARAAKVARQAGERPASRERFEDYVERWLIEYSGRTSGGIAPGTRDAYAIAMRVYVVPYFRGYRLGDVGPSDVKGFVAHLARLAPRRPQHGATCLAASTVRRIMVPLKAMLAEAFELEIIRSDAARVRVIVPGERPQRRVDTLTAQQVAAAIAYATDRDRLLVQSLSLTGLRISEALGLQWGDIDYDDGGPVVTVERQCINGKLRGATKTRSSERQIALVPSLAAAMLLGRSQARFAADGDPMFSSRSGAHQDSHNVRPRIKRALAAAGAPWATPHTFRHTFATNLLAHGHDSTVVAKVLGHCNDVTTRRVYLHAPTIPRFDDIEPTKRR